MYIRHLAQKRSFGCSHCGGAIGEIDELLAEIDALRDDYGNSLRDTVDLLKERDQLKSENKVLMNKIAQFTIRSDDLRNDQF